ncbi:hypothetical protein [Bifidobacterium longum]|uniref:hypothetical protein n=1 Tax=Bifidobacterium longum TaxID=216816 RepID=UPI001C38817A|nr:hypothetical protein [Bifidobacterium longum]MBV4145954.1 hypothetical protein [Bifidobacterium longum]MBV4156313.1 hypothetical protein [Bifidobacterium longum]MBV4158052.1 hypothetical protein [Bifidobacterium longum]MBV4162147.1 hypothetical protein [Bifidobacterium longum]MBV4165939.1 hypothetical protein [Bifidobacterium longum]
MVSTVTVGLEQSFDVSVTTRVYAGIFFRNSYNWARFLMLHEYCLNALVGLSCDPARTFRVAALVHTSP